MQKPEIRQTKPGQHCGASVSLPSLCPPAFNIASHRPYSSVSDDGGPMILAYCGPFVMLGSIPVFYMVFGSAGPLLTIASLLLALTGAEAVYARGEPINPRQSQRAFRLLAFVYVPLQLIEIVWAMNEAVHQSLTGYLALLFSTGILTGVFGML